MNNRINNGINKGINRISAIVVILCILSILALPKGSSLAIDVAPNKNKDYYTGALDSILYSIVQGDKQILRTISYSRLQEFSVFIRYKVGAEASTFANVLWANSRRDNQRNVVRAFLSGLLNKDPKVRLFCARMLLKLGIKREWAELAVQRALDPEGFTRETADSYYFYMDIYGNMQRENLKYALPRILELGSQIILLSPIDNISKDKIDKDKGILFEWSTLHGADTYDFYIGDTLYYSGEESFVFMRSDLPIGIIEWSVASKDSWGNYIKIKESTFEIMPSEDSAASEENDAKDKELDFSAKDFE